MSINNLMITTKEVLLVGLLRNDVSEEIAITLLDNLDAEIEAGTNNLVFKNGRTYITTAENAKYLQEIGLEFVPVKLDDCLV